MHSKHDKVLCLLLNILATFKFPYEYIIMHGFLGHNEMIYSVCEGILWLDQSHHGSSMPDFFLCFSTKLPTGKWYVPFTEQVENNHKDEYKHLSVEIISLVSLVRSKRTFYQADTVKCFHEVWHFSKISSKLLKNHIKSFLMVKEEASG